MKKQRKQPAKPGPTPASGVQRTTVKRAQQAGKRSARAGASRLAGPAPETPEVAISANARRGFVWVLIGLAVALLLVALFQNRASWLSALSARPIAPQSPQQTALSGTNPISPTLPDTASGGVNDWQNRVGIVSGHRGNDSGTVCSDGLTEAQVNFDAATRTASILRAQGYTVDVLGEFDEQLKGYRALALLSIHADSCDYINDLTTGYKVARFLYSAIPEQEDKLVACVSSRYKKATGLQFHRTTVTHNMLEYHAFREIDPKTPGAIIELGFMYKDRNVLVGRKDAVGQGVANGLLCFLRNEAP